MFSLLFRVSPQDRPSTRCGGSGPCPYRRGILRSPPRSRKSNPTRNHPEYIRCLTPFACFPDAHPETGVDGEPPSSSDRGGPQLWTSALRVYPEGATEKQSQRGPRWRFGLVKDGGIATLARSASEDLLVFKAGRYRIASESLPRTCAGRTT